MKTNQLFFFMSLAFFLLACGESEEILTLNEGSIANEFHKAHVGQILFDTKYHKPAEYTDAHIKKSISLSSEDEFFARMFLEKTQTYYLHQLAPELPVNELCKKGSYQFTFYVDGKKAYTNNLQTGAGSCSFRNESTSIYLPLISEDDHWGKFQWLKFIKKEGGQKALADGPHLLKIEVRPYIETTELKVGEIIAEGEVTLEFLTKAVSEADMAIQAIAPNSGWEGSTEALKEDLIKELNKKIQQDYYKNITSIVVAKNGKLLLEEYFNGTNRESLHNTRSVGKSFTSALTGIAIQEGHLKSETATLKDFYELKKYQNHSIAKEKVNIKDLLTMSSSFAASDMPGAAGSEDEMQETENWMKFTLDLAADDSKAKSWDYWTPGTMLLGDILNKTVPGGLEDYADKKLFAPLGITNYKWHHSPQKVAYTGGGMEMNSLSHCRFGQVYLDEGMANGQQILSKEWVSASLSKQIPVSGREGEHYGYLFWQKEYPVGDKNYEVYYASGNGGNKIYIIKELNLIAVITATAYGQPYGHLQADEILTDYILSAIER